MINFNLFSLLFSPQTDYTSICACALTSFAVQVTYFSNYVRIDNYLWRYNYSGTFLLNHIFSFYSIFQNFMIARESNQYLF